MEKYVTDEDSRKTIVFTIFSVYNEIKGIRQVLYYDFVFYFIYFSTFYSGIPKRQFYYI